MCVKYTTSSVQRDSNVSQCHASECLWLLLLSFGNRGNHREKRRIYDRCIVTLSSLCNPRGHDVAEHQQWHNKRFATRDSSGGSESVKGKWRWKEQIDGAERKLFFVITAVYPFERCDLLSLTNSDTSRHGHTVISQSSCKSRFICLFSPLIKRLPLSIQFAHKWNH